MSELIIIIKIAIFIVGWFTVAGFAGHYHAKEAIGWINADAQQVVTLNNIADSYMRDAVKGSLGLLALFIALYLFQGNFEITW